tara:strand:- start:869 stop:1222 length:354 start_codon:yes stop_codon:yes gene_type:complete
MFSIGTDIIKTKRVKKLIDSKGDVFLNKIFTAKEINYCNSNSQPYLHFSGKYAAKEAIKKALLSNALVNSISIKNIEILNNKDKSPFVSIQSLSALKINISISHEKKYAIAFALIEK